MLPNYGQMYCFLMNLRFYVMFRLIDEKSGWVLVLK
jgi:hypothetical protein